MTGGTIQLGGPINAGSLVLTSTSLSAAGSINVGTFFLSDGVWSQVGSGSLPSFNASSFFGMGPDAPFLQAVGGDGVSSPYLLADIYGVMGIGSPGLQGLSFALANDINASGASFDPIAGTFTGTFDGQGHTISNLSIIGSSTSSVGLLSVNAGQIRNLSLTDVSVVALSGDGSQTIGAIAGFNDVGGVISNVRVTVSDISSSDLAGQASVGGVVGVNAGTISGAAVVSGSGSGVISGISGTTAVGGIAGSNLGTISNSYARVGIAFGTIVMSRFAPDFPSTSEGAAGGLVGMNAGTILNS